MRACGWLLITACTADPSLAITVHHPTGFAVAQTMVAVYFGGDVRCDDIMYGDRTASALAALVTDEADVTNGGRVDVSRLGGKSIVARGYDAEHRFVTAGCKDLGEITEGAELAIATQPTAVVAIEPGLPEIPLGQRRIAVNMTDPNGAPIDGLVSWQLTGPAGAPDQPASAGVMTQGGDATIMVTDLGVPGPEGLRIRVPWAIAPLPLVTGFDLSRAITVDLGAGSGGRPACDVRGHAGARATLVCLTPPDGQGHRDAVELAWDGAQYTRRPIAIPSGMDNQFAVVVDHDGSADEPVYVISANLAGLGSWYRLGAPSGTAVTFAGPLEAVVYVPRCNDISVAAAIGVQTGSGPLGHKRRFYSVAGAPDARGAVDGEIVAGGCISDVDRIEHQAVVTSIGTDEPLLALLTPSGPEQVSSNKLNGAGFVAVRTGGSVEQRFAGTRLQATGTVVYEAVLARAGNGYKLVERTELDCAAPPTKVRAGLLDHDGDTDLMWDLGTALRRHTYQVSLAREVGGEPLTAITSGSAPASTPALTDFAVGDLNGGSADEMIVFSPNTVTIYSAD